MPSTRRPRTTVNCSTEPRRAPSEKGPLPAGGGPSALGIFALHDRHDRFSWFVAMTRGIILSPHGKNGVKTNNFGGPDAKKECPAASPERGDERHGLHQSWPPRSPLSGRCGRWLLRAHSGTDLPPRPRPTRRRYGLAVLPSRLTLSPRPGCRAGAISRRCVIVRPTGGGAAWRPALPEAPNLIGPVSCIERAARLLDHPAGGPRVGPPLFFPARRAHSSREGRSPLDCGK